MAPKRKTYIKNCTGDNCESSVKIESRGLIARIIFYLLLIAFIFSLIYMLFFSMQMQINNIEVVGTKDLDSQEIRHDIQQHLQGKYFKILPKNNFLFISRNRLQNYLKDNYKKIRSVNVQKKFPESINIEIDEHVALLVWCKNNENCYLLDEDGVAYGVADFDSPELTQNNLLRINDDSNADVEIGVKVMDTSYEQYLLGIGRAIGILGIRIEEGYSTPSRMAEEIKTKSDSGFGIYFSTQFSLESAINTLGVLLKKEISKEQLSNLEYIDLRSEYKAFYKFKSVEGVKVDEEKPSE
ncbi:MAG: hypothetical protein US63_C0015G0010 [Candidatus Moranbacteria bacterium GW2011_GWC2_37_8]|nr:MAG: hypothetical protein US63_C0015G0010 [Candidatus Moranbacteria bacterium GW2011_GWC2_37_8]